MSFGEDRALEGTKQDGHPRNPFTTHETERRTLIEIEAAPDSGNIPATAYHAEPFEAPERRARWVERM